MAERPKFDPMSGAVLIKNNPSSGFDPMAGVTPIEKKNLSQSGTELPGVKPLSDTNEEEGMFSRVLMAIPRAFKGVGEGAWNKIIDEGIGAARELTVNLMPDKFFSAKKMSFDEKLKAYESTFAPMIEGQKVEIKGTANIIDEGGLRLPDPEAFGAALGEQLMQLQRNTNMGGMVLNHLSFAESNYQEARQRGIDPTKSYFAGHALALTETLIDKYSGIDKRIDKFLSGKLGKMASDEAIDQIIKLGIKSDAFDEAVKTSGGLIKNLFTKGVAPESISEGIQQVVTTGEKQLFDIYQKATNQVNEGDINKKGQYGADVFSMNTVRDIANSSFMGGLVGGLGYSFTSSGDFNPTIYATLQREYNEKGKDGLNTSIENVKTGITKAADAGKLTPEQYNAALQNVDKIAKNVSSFEQNSKIDPYSRYSLFNVEENLIPMVSNGLAKDLAQMATPLEMPTTQQIDDDISQGNVTPVSFDHVSDIPDSYRNFAAVADDQNGNKVIQFQVPNSIVKAHTDNQITVQTLMNNPLFAIKSLSDNNRLVTIEDLEKVGSGGGEVFPSSASQLQFKVKFEQNRPQLINGLKTINYLKSVSSQVKETGKATDPVAFSKAINNITNFNTGDTIFFNDKAHKITGTSLDGQMLNLSGIKEQVNASDENIKTQREIDEVAAEPVVAPTEEPTAQSEPTQGEPVVNAPVAEEQPLEPAQKTINDAVYDLTPFVYQGKTGRLRQQSNGVVMFETKDRDYELGNIADIGGMALSEWDIVQQEMSTDKSFSVTIDGKTFTNKNQNPFAAITYDESGNPVSVKLQDEKGKTKVIKGTRALLIDAQYKERKILNESTDEQLNEVEQQVAAGTENIGNAEPTTVGGQVKPVEPAFTEKQRERQRTINEVAKRLAQETENTKNTKAAIVNITSSLFKAGVKVQVLTSAQIKEKYNDDDTTQGFFIAKDGTIVINQNVINNEWGKTIVFHEGTHPIINIIRNTDPKTFKQLMDAIRDMRSTNTIIDSIIKSIEANPTYKGQFTQNDEIVVETIARIASGKLKLNDLPLTLSQKIKDLINKIGRALGFKQVIRDNNDVAFIRLANQISEVLNTGKDISEIVGEQNITSYRRSGVTAVQNRSIEEMTMSANNVLYSDSAILPKPDKKTQNANVAISLQTAAIDYWGDIVTSSNITSEQEDLITQNGIEEAKAAYDDSGKNAANWYSTAIETAIAVAGVIHPELNSNGQASTIEAFSKEKEPAKAAQLVLRMALAITSQNLNVDANTIYAEEQYNYFKENGKFDPSKEYGAKAPAISSNLRLANLLINTYGINAAEDFISKEFTVRQLEEAFKIATGKKLTILGLRNDTVNGAAIFGPKIGQGFLQNLMGKFDPVTIDLWMRRTWGRWTGDVVGTGITEDRMARLYMTVKDAIKNKELKIDLPKEFSKYKPIEKKDKKGKSSFTMGEDFSNRLENDLDFTNVLNDVSKEISLKASALYKAIHDIPMSKNLYDKFISGEMSYVEVANKSTALDSKLKENYSKYAATQKSKGLTSLSLNDKKVNGEIIKGWKSLEYERIGNTYSPSNEDISKRKPQWGNAAKNIISDLNPIDVPSNIDRRVITRIVNNIKNGLNKDGYNVTNADVQALLWYPEKDIWAKLRGESESNLKLSYDDQFIKIANQRGLGEQAQSVATEIRNRRAEPNISESERQGNESVLRTTNESAKVASTQENTQFSDINRNYTMESTIADAGITMAEKEAWQERNRVSQRQERNPVTQQGVEMLRDGLITLDRYVDIVRANMPIYSMPTVPKIPTFKEIVGALNKQALDKGGIVGLNKTFKDGERVASRLDIPAYNYFNTWVVSIHEGINNIKNGKILGYGQTAVLKNIVFGTDPLAAMNIAIDKGKVTVARIYGDWVNESPESAHKRATKLMNDPAWTQVGMNPYRHSFFYDKSTGEALIGAEEVIQVGALVLAKNVKRAPIGSQAFNDHFTFTNKLGEQIQFSEISRDDERINDLRNEYYNNDVTTDVLIEAAKKQYGLDQAAAEMLVSKATGSVLDLKPYESNNKAELSDEQMPTEVESIIDKYTQGYEKDKANKLKQESKKKTFADYAVQLYDSKFKIRRILQSLSDMQTLSSARLRNIMGKAKASSMEAQQAIAEIYGGLGEKQIKALDELIFALRVIQLDKNNSEKVYAEYDRLRKQFIKENNGKLPNEKDLEKLIQDARKSIPELHNGLLDDRLLYTPKTAQSLIDALRGAYSTEDFDNLMSRAAAYKRVGNESITKMQEAGHLSKEIADKYKDDFYAFRKTLERYYDDYSSNVPVYYKDGVAYYSAFKSLGEGSKESYFQRDSRVLLAENILIVNKAIAKNNLRKSIFDDIMSNPKDFFTNADSKQSVITDKNGADLSFAFKPAVYARDKDGNIKKEVSGYVVEPAAEGFVNVPFRMDGKLQYFQMEKDLYDEVEGLNSVFNPQDSGVIVMKYYDVSNLANTMLTATQTRYNPFFFWRNMSMDIRHQVHFTDFWTSDKNFLKSNVYSAYGRLLFASIKNAKKIISNDEDMLRLIDEATKVGLFMDTYSEAKEQVKRSSEIDVESLSLNKQSKWESVKKGFGYMNVKTEIAMRISAYEQAKKHLTEQYKKLHNVTELNDAQADEINEIASAQARGYTDFAQKGTITPHLNFAYLNASIQGLGSALEYSYDNPAKTLRKSSELFIGHMLWTTMLMMAIPDLYDELDEYTKDVHMLSPMGFMKDKLLDSLGLPSFFIPTSKIDPTLVPLMGIARRTAEHFVKNMRGEQTEPLTYEEVARLINIALPSIFSIPEKTAPVDAAADWGSKILSGSALLSSGTKLFFGYDAFRGQDIDAKGFQKSSNLLDGMTNPDIPYIYKIFAKASALATEDPNKMLSPARINAAAESIIGSPKSSFLTGILTAVASDIANLIIPASEIEKSDVTLFNPKNILKSFGVLTDSGLKERLQNKKFLEESSKLNLKAADIETIADKNIDLFYKQNPATFMSRVEKYSQEWDYAGDEDATDRLIKKAELKFNKLENKSGIPKDISNEVKVVYYTNGTDNQAKMLKSMAGEDRRMANKILESLSGFGMDEGKIIEIEEKYYKK